MFVLFFKRREHAFLRQQTRNVEARKRSISLSVNAHPTAVRLSRVTPGVSLRLGFALFSLVWGRFTRSR